MTWEYSGDPTTSTKDEVRFLMQDTDDADHLVEDEEIDYLLSAYGSPLLAAANGLQTLGNRYARQVTKAVGDLRIELSERAAQFREAAAGLFQQAGGSAVNVPGVAPWVGGLSIQEKTDADADEDLVRSDFWIGMHDNDVDDQRGRRRDSDYGTLGS